MKKWVLYLGLIVASFGMTGCSEENYFEESLGEEWNGEGLPTWIGEWSFKHWIQSNWATSSASFEVLWKAYKFEHDGRLLLAMSYEKVYYIGYKGEFWEENTLCCDTYGRDVSFSAVESSFEKGAELIWTNEICTEKSIPQISDCELENPQSLNWLQKDIDKACREVQKAGNFMLVFDIGYCDDESGNPYVYLVYEYAVRAEKNRIKVSNVYTMDGEKVDAASKEFNWRESLWKKVVGPNGIEPELRLK